MSVLGRTYEKQALELHYVRHGGLAFVDRAAALHVVVAAQDEVERLTAQLAGAVDALMAISDELSIDEAQRIAREALEASGGATLTD